MNARLTSRLAGALCSALAMSISGANGVAAAAAQSAPETGGAIAFDIPAQPLGDALRAFSIQTRIQIAIPGEDAAGEVSSPVRGAYVPSEALAMLLRGTGLEARRTGARSFALVATGPETALRNHLGDADVIVVYGDRAYRPGGGAGTKVDIPFLESPVSVQVISDALIRDQQANRIQEALKNVAAFQTAYSFGPIQDTFILRGFQLGSDTTAAGYRDGVLLNAYNYATAGIERVEVLKGPASVLYGRAEPGGLVNVVTKKALPEFAADIAFQTGSFEFYRALADVGGPVDEDSGVSFRLVGEYLDRESFRDFIFEEQAYGLGALRWDAPTGTTIELQFEVRDLDALDDPGLPVIGDRPAPLSPETYLGEPEIGFQERFDTVVDLDIEHPLNENWLVRGKAAYVRSEQEYLGITLGDLDEATGDLERGFFGGEATYETVYGSAELVGEFALGVTEHKLLIGVDRYSDRLDETIFFTFLDFGAIAPVNIFNPVLGQSRAPDVPVEDRFPGERQTTWTGLYVQDHIKIGERFSVLPGLRWDNTRVESDSIGEAIERDFVSPRLGAVYQLTDYVSVYGQWTRGFGANNGRSATGEAFDPERSRQYEAGVKAEFAGGRLTAQAAFYDIVKENVLVADVSTPDDPFDSIAIGEIESRGLELELLGEATDALSVTLSYAYNDIEIVRDTEGNEGNRLLNAPEHAVSAFARYDLTPDITLGGGVFYVSERQGDNANTFQLPGYARTDLFAQYRFRLGGADMQAQINVNNVLDKEYFLAASDFAPRVNPGAAREVRFEISASF